MRQKRTKAANRWLTRARQTLTPRRYQRILYHIDKVGQGARGLTRIICLKALVALWAEEGLPEVQDGD